MPQFNIVLLAQCLKAVELRRWSQISKSTSHFALFFVWNISNIQISQIICVLVPAACSKAGECECLFSNIKAEHLRRGALTVWPLATTSLLLPCIETPTSPWIKTPPPSCPKLPIPSTCLQETSTPIPSCLPVSFCHIPDFWMFHVYPGHQVANTELQSNWPSSLSACRL